MTLPEVFRQYQLSQPGTYNNLNLVEVSTPKLKAGEVLVKVHAVSLQYRDLMVTKGVYPGGSISNVVPCSDLAGTIAAVSADLEDGRWKIGDRVAANFSPKHLSGTVTPEIFAASFGAKNHGVLADYRAVPADALVGIPEHLSFEEASTLPCAAVTAYNALYGPVQIKAGDYVLVLGTGGVSISDADTVIWLLDTLSATNIEYLGIAVASGATVIATSSSDEKLDVAKKLGAKHTINYKTTPEWDQEVLRITGGKGVDHVLEVGGAATLEKSINSARMGSGQIHVIGFVGAGSIPEHLVSSIIVKAITLRGILIGSVAQFEDLLSLIEANPATTKPLVDKVFPFEQTTDAFAYLDSQKHVGKVVIKVSA